MKWLLGLFVGLYASAALAASPTAVQWGADRGVSPWTVGVFDGTQTFRPLFTQPSSGVPILLNSAVPTPTATSLGGIESFSAPANQFLTGVNTSGVPQSAQPSFSNLSGSATAAQMPAFTGDCTTSAGAVSLTCTKTNGTAFGYFATGTNAANLTGTVPATTLPLPTATTLGGVESSSAPTNEFQTGINTSGQPTFAQPSFSNLSGSVIATQMPAFTGDCTTIAGTVSLTCTKTNGIPFTSAATTAIGTSGATIPLLNGNNIFSGTTEFDGKMTGADASGLNNLFGAIYPMAPPYNCAGNGTTDDYTCMNNAVSAAESNNQTVFFGPHLYAIGTEITMSGGGVRFQGTLAAWLGGTSDQCNSGLKALNTNQNLISFSGGSVWDSACADMGTGVNTSGTAFEVPNVNSVKIRHSIIEHACVAADLSGNSLVFDDNYIVQDGGGTGCIGIEIGRLTTHGGTVDPRITNNTIQCNSANPCQYGQLILDAGGLYESGNDDLYASIGTAIYPNCISTTGQWVQWPFIINTVLGDTTAQQALYINTGCSAAVVAGGSFTNSWASSSVNSNNVEIHNDGGGLVQSLTFNAFRALGAQLGNGVVLYAGQDLTFTGGSMICGYHDNGIVFATTTPSDVKVTNSTIGETCADQSYYGSPGTIPTSGIGIVYDSNNYVTVVGDNLRLNATETSGTLGTNPQTGYNQ